MSRFTGAFRELLDAVLMNPYATNEFAEAILGVVEMPLDERQRQMQKGGGGKGGPREQRAQVNG